MKSINTTSLIILISFILHMISPYFSVGFYAMDEHFQILEPLAYILKTREVHWNQLWEFGAGMRPWSQIYFYYIIIQILLFFKIYDVFIWIQVIQTILSLIGFLSLIIFYKTLKEKFAFKDTKFNIFFLFLFSFFIFLHSRTSSENLSISLFIIGLSIIIISKKYNNRLFILNFLFAGIFFSFSILARYQMIFLIGPLFIWLLFFYYNFTKVFLLGLIIILGLLAGLYVDSIGYKFLNNTYYNYYYYNMVVGIFDNFGIEPWWFYIYEVSLKFFPPIGLIFFISALLYWTKNYKNFITWITLPYFLIFCYLGHKEIRFLFPILFFSPVFIIWFLEYLRKFNYLKTEKNIKIILIISNILFLTYAFIPADRQVDLYKNILKKDINENIYYYGKNPYKIDGLEPYFYTSALPLITEIKDKSHLNTIIKKTIKLKKYYIITKNYNFYKSLKINNNKLCKKIYSSYPENIINLNPNWKKRNINWFILECRNI